MSKLDKLKIGDRLYGYYIEEAELNKFEMIVSDDTIRTREPMIFCPTHEDYIVAVTWDEEEWWIGNSEDDNVLYLVSRDGLKETLDMIISEESLDFLPIKNFEPFKKQS